MPESRTLKGERDSIATATDCGMLSVNSFEMVKHSFFVAVSQTDKKFQAECQVVNHLVMSLFYCIKVLSRSNTTQFYDYVGLNRGKVIFELCIPTHLNVYHTFQDERMNFLMNTSNVNAFSW